MEILALMLSIVAVAIAIGNRRSAAYLAPAILAALFGRAFRRRNYGFAAVAASVAGLALGFFYLSLEVRHLFQGSYFDHGPPSDAEWYVYFAVWLLYGLD